MISKVFLLPDLGEGLQEATIHTWHADKGDTLQPDDLIVTVETSKSVVEITAPCKLKLTGLGAPTGETVQVGAPLYHYDQAQKPSMQPRAIPRARILAKEYGIDLHRIKPSRADGTITVADVQLHRHHAQPAPRTQSMDSLTSSAWMRAVQTSAFDDIILPNDFHKPHLLWAITKTIASRIDQYPRMNGSYNNQQFTPSSSIHLALPRFVDQTTRIVVIRDAQLLSKSSFREKLDALKKGLTPDGVDFHHQTATLLISNVGMYGGRFFTPLVLPPMTLSVALGAIKDAVVAIQGQAVVRKILPISLTADHRAVDGANLVMFLAELKRVFENIKHPFMDCDLSRITESID
ncbi:MAG: 2-oxo acid dehydrogenase subunit E2 [Pseudomonadota bacterium]|nr:2-oxo acid dehydrogenase subunit E2 [Pseudomonadota bacterium]